MRVSKRNSHTATWNADSSSHAGWPYFWIHSVISSLSSHLSLTVTFPWLLLTALGPSLPSSSSGLVGNLARKPFVWVSCQNRQRNPLTGTHPHPHPQKRMPPIVQHKSFDFKVVNYAPMMRMMMYYQPVNTLNRETINKLTTPLGLTSTSLTDQLCLATLAIWPVCRTASFTTSIHKQTTPLGPTSHQLFEANVDQTLVNCRINDRNVDSLAPGIQQVLLSGSLQILCNIATPKTCPMVI